MTRVKVTRHTALFRALHWLIFIEGVILGLTGLQLGGIWDVRVLPGGTSRAVHVVAGLAWIFTCLFFIYFFIASGDYKWYGLKRIPYSLRYLVAEAKAWLGVGLHVEEPIKYDAKKGEYVEKIVPTEVVVWWIYVVLGLIIGFTGLAMAFPEQFAIVYQIAGAFATVFGGGPYAMTRAIHLLAMFLVLTVAILHAYAAWVFRMLRSITFGDRDEPVVE